MKNRTFQLIYIKTLVSMPSAVGAPQTLGQRSRKGKKAWRKNVDVSEIQEGLQTAREEVIKGSVQWSSKMPTTANTLRKRHPSRKAFRRFIHI